MELLEPSLYHPGAGLVPDRGFSVEDQELEENPRYRVYAFHSEILPDDRQVVVYVPPQYEEDRERRFPVFYLHDGQNLFDGRTSYLAGRTWEAHTSADRLALSGEMEPAILVGVANTGLRRMAEYTPTRDWKQGGGEGESYGRMLREELKPAIDTLYRTRSGPESTGVGGSSLGGLISLYLGFTHPEVFGRLAVLSPSLWWDRHNIFSLIEQRGPRPDLRIWLDIGTEEGARHVKDTELLERMLVRRGWREGLDLKYLRVEGGTHDERAWAARFGEVLKFLFPGK